MSPSLAQMACACAFLLLSCSSPPTRTAATAGPVTNGIEIQGKTAARTALTHPDAVGVSGSCRAAGFTWLITERNSNLLRLDDEGKIESFALEGVPDAIDLEALACKDERFYIATESNVEHRTGDLVLIVEIQDSIARVVDALTMHYPDGLEAGQNQGLEGLCIAGDWLIAAGEILRTDSAGTRQAPLLRQKIGEEDTFMHWVNLSTNTGKISGLDCRLKGDKVEVFAIERHFEVGRLLHFELGDAPSEASLIVNIAHLLQSTENYESLLVDDEGRAHLCNDNQYATITGPTEILELSPVPAFARH